MRTRKKFRENFSPVLLAETPFRCFITDVAKVKARKVASYNGRKPDLRAEAVVIRDLVDSVIKEGKAKAFLIDHGFATKGGRLAKRYGG
jgi:hypothetical protein